MSRLRAVAAALTLGTPFAATAADVTRVASSFEEDDPFGMFIDVGAEHVQHRTHILREIATSAEDTRQLKSELAYSEYQARLNVDIAAGISKDVELSFGLPVVLLHNEYWNYAEGVTPETSTVRQENLFTQMPWKAYHGGLGNARFGLGWAIFNQKRDDTKPTWVARFNYEAPTATRLDPALSRQADQPRTPVGDRVHKYTLSTALSRQIGLAEPYFKASYTIPVRGPGAYSNCEHPELLDAAYGNNCFQNGWDRAQTGTQAPQVLGVMVGSEFQLIDNPTRYIRLDVRAVGNFVGAGRYYNELSGALGRMLSSSEYLQVGGQAGLTLRLAEAIAIRGSAMFLYSTDHALTSEAPGRDSNEDGKADFEDIAATPGDRNPSFDPRVDLPSRRFFASETRDLRFDATITFAF